MDHQHSRPRPAGGVVPGEETFEDLIALMVFDDLGLHGGVKKRGRQQDCEGKEKNCFHEDAPLVTVFVNACHSCNQAAKCPAGSWACRTTSEFLPPRSGAGDGGGGKGCCVGTG